MIRVISQLILFSLIIDLSYAKTINIISAEYGAPPHMFAIESNRLNKIVNLTDVVKDDCETFSYCEFHVRNDRCCVGCPYKVQAERAGEEGGPELRVLTKNGDPYRFFNKKLTVKYNCVGDDDNLLNYTVVGSEDSTIKISCLGENVEKIADNFESIYG